MASKSEPARVWWHCSGTTLQCQSILIVLLTSQWLVCGLVSDRLSASLLVSVCTSVCMCLQRCLYACLCASPLFHSLSFPPALTLSLLTILCHPCCPSPPFLNPLCATSCSVPSPARMEKLQNISRLEALLHRAQYLYQISVADSD